MGWDEGLRRLRVRVSWGAGMAGCRMCGSESDACMFVTTRDVVFPRMTQRFVRPGE
jgi:hypothetical protein